MAYLGVPQSKLENLTTNVQIVNLSASFDGTTTTFNLQDSRGDAVYAVADRALLVILGGITQRPGVDYTTSGTTITFTTAPVANLTIAIRKLYGVQRIIGVNDGVISPVKLSTGGPVWNASGNVTISGDLNVTGAFNAGGNGLFWEDSERANFGDNNDLHIYHDGNSYLNSTSGNLYIKSENDTDIYVRAADDLFLQAGGTSPGVKVIGGGATELYHPALNEKKLETTSTGILLTSSDAGSAAEPEIDLFRDSASPADADYLGQIKFTGKQDGGGTVNYAKITGKILDASNGTEDGILEFMLRKAGSNNIAARFRSDSLQLLNGTSLRVVGSGTFGGTNTPVEQLAVYSEDDASPIDTGLSVYRSTADDKVTINAQGGAAKFIADGGSSYIPVRFFRHNGTNTYETLTIGVDGKVGIGQTNPTSDLHIGNISNGYELKITGNALQFNRSSNSYIDQVHDTGNILFRMTSSNLTKLRINHDGTIKLPNDNQKLMIGSGDDLQLYHTGNHSRILEAGTGKLQLGSDTQVEILNGAFSVPIAQFNPGGSVVLRHNTTTTLETTATGIDVTGDVTADSFIMSDEYPTSAPILDLNFAREKRLDSRITFTRNSVATYFDAESSEVLEENNMDYASNFSGQWTVVGGTLSTSSWARPIPGWDSQEVTLFTENTSGGTHRIYRGIQNRFYDNDQLEKFYTFSFFAKYSSGRQFLQLNAASISYNARIIFDIQNGSVSDYGSALYAGVIGHGNGWYRCWATVRGDTIAPVQQSVSCPVGGNSSATGNGESYTGNQSSFYLWGYQVEFSDTLGPFVQTNGKTFRKLGPVIKTVPVDEPRFVYDPSTKESLGLLIEQERTNKQPFTNNLTSAIATNGVTSEVSTWNNIARAPNGRLEAGRVKGSGASGGNQRLGFNYAIANGEDGAFSAFLKADPNNSGDIIVHLYTNTFIAGNSAFNVNLNDGTSNVVGGTSDLFTKVEPYPDGWYRVTIGGTSSGATNGSVNINIADSLTAARVATSNSSNAYFIWGVQFETGSLNDSTSYIENTSTGTKTRSAELAEMRGLNFSSWFNNTEGTILAEYRGGGLTSEIPLHISDESYTSNTSIQIGSSSSGPISGFVTSVSINNRGTSEASWQANTAYPTEGESIKTALTYKHNYAQMVTTDGSGTYTGSVDTSVDLPWLNMMTIGKDSYYGIWNNNPIKRLAFYGTTLTEAQLQNIIKY